MREHEARHAANPSSPLLAIKIELGSRFGVTVGLLSRKIVGLVLLLDCGLQVRGHALKPAYGGFECTVRRVPERVLDGDGIVIERDRGRAVERTPETSFVGAPADCVSVIERVVSDSQVDVKDARAIVVA